MKSPIEYLKRLMRNDRAWRIFLISAFVIPILLVLPHARSLVVRNAVTTAYLDQLNAPISGRVVDIGVSAGSRSQQGVVAVAVHNDKVDGSRVARLEVLRAEGEAEVARLRMHLDSVRLLAEARRGEMHAYSEAVTQDLGSRLQSANDRSAALQSALREAEGNLNRVRKLFSDGLLSQADLEAAEAVYESALADQSANQQERSRLEQQLEEIRKSVFQVDVPDGALLTRQSVQELDLEVMRLEQALGESEALLRATSAELERAEAAYRLASRADVQIPEGTVVWNLHTALGAWANEGSPLLSFVDCSNLMLDIAVDDATLELIEPGIEIRVRLFGSFRYRTGEVILVRGSSALSSDLPVLAAKAANRGQREGQVLARLDASDLSSDPAKSCGIGRTAYVEFEDINLFEMLILPLFR